MRHERYERAREREWRRANYRGDDCRTVTTTDARRPREAWCDARPASATDPAEFAV